MQCGSRKRVLHILLKMYSDEIYVCAIFRLMPHLKYIIENAPAELRQLRGKTLECFSLIGLAVGREKVEYSIL